MREHSEMNSHRNTIIVVGATSSIGSALCRKLVQQGHRVIAAGRHQERLEALSQTLDISNHTVDAQEPDSLVSCINDVQSEYGEINGVVNCIGSVLLKPAHLTSMQEWDNVLTINLTTAFVTVQAAAKAMRNHGGSIVLVSSAAASIGLANHEAISAAKAGINGLTLSAAATYANYNIRVNAVAPGLVKSAMTSNLWDNDASASVSKSMHALGRLGEPEHIASAIKWLLDPENDWITGQIIGVDGGLGALVPRIKSRI